jgi:lysozyme
VEEVDMQKLVDDLKQEEGLRLAVYLDHLGHPTVGYGCRVQVGDKINMKTAEALFAYRLSSVISDFYRIPRSRTKHLNETRRRVICKMIYQMGLTGTLAFKRMWAAIERDDFDTAADEILDSTFARDPKTAARAGRLAEEMRKGAEP